MFTLGLRNYFASVAFCSSGRRAALTLMLVNLFEVTLFSVLCSMGMMGISSAAITSASCISWTRSPSSTVLLASSSLASKSALE